MVVILFAGIWLHGNTCIRAKDVKFVLPTTTTGADALFNTYRRTGEDHWVVELSSIGLAEDRLPLPLEGLVWTTFEPEQRIGRTYCGQKRKYRLKTPGRVSLTECGCEKAARWPKFTSSGATVSKLGRRLVTSTFQSCQK